LSAGRRWRRTSTEEKRVDHFVDRVLAILSGAILSKLLGATRELFIRDELKGGKCSGRHVLRVCRQVGRDRVHDGPLPHQRQTNLLRGVRHLLARRKARHVDLACRRKERQPPQRVKDLDRRIDDEDGAIVRENPGTFTQGGKRVGEVVVDKKEEDEVHCPFRDGKRPGRRANPADCSRLGNRSRGCQHPLRPINTRHGRSEHLSKKRREPSDATTQVNDASNVDAVKLTT